MKTTRGVPAPGGAVLTLPRGFSLRANQLATLGAMLAGGLIAFGLVVFTLSRHNALYGLTEYDDGVYFASAMRLVHGQLPYRDFVMVQPPGITVAMSPLAIIGRIVGSREGLALARMLTAVVAGANAVLLASLFRHKGRIAMLVAGVTFGLFPPAFIADRTLELEPYLVLFCLIGTALLFTRGEFASRRRIIAAGFFFGIAGTMKSFAVLAVIAIVIFLAVKRMRDLLPFVAAVAVGFLVICLPFFIGSPHGFIHDVIASQLGRQTLARATLPTRLAALTGLADAIPTLRHFGPHNALPAVIAVVMLCIAFFGEILPAIIGRSSSLERVAIVGAILSVGAILAAPSFYNHYCYFSEVFIAMIFGFVAARAVGLFRRMLHAQHSMVGLSVYRGAVLLGLCVVSVCAAVLIGKESSYAASIMDKDGDPGPAIARFIPKGACAISDAASLLVAANRISSGKPDCPALIDATGTWIATDPNDPPLQCRCGPPEPKLTAEWKQWLETADYAIFSGVHSFRIPWTPALYLWFDTHWARVPGSPLPVFERIMPGSGLTPIGVSGVTGLTGTTGATGSTGTTGTHG